MKRILRRFVTYDRTGMGRAATDALEAEGKHPKRVVIKGTPKKPILIGYMEDEVDAWIEERRALRDAE